MNKEDFVKELNKINIKITAEEIDKLNEFKDLILEYNNKFNLTAIKDEESIYLKHFYDCLYLLTVEEIKISKNILDIGTGAGFPGIILAIMLSDKIITLVEANSKKCGFLRKVCDELKLENVNIVNDRAEDYAKKNREKFDIVTSRAVSDLLVLSELSLPTLKINGYFLPMKSHYEKELNDSLEKINKLGGKVIDISKYNLPIENSVRSIIKIIKTKKTDEKYPRDYSKIIKDLKKSQK